MAYNVPNGILSTRFNCILAIFPCLYKYNEKPPDHKKKCSKSTQISDDNEHIFITMEKYVVM